MTDPTPITLDLSEALSKALIERFFSSGTQTATLTPSGMVMMNPTTSPLAMVAGLMFSAHAKEITDELWRRISLDELTEAVAANLAAGVVKSYTENPNYYGARHPEQDKLRARVLEIVAQTLGQRVVDQMDVTLSSKPDAINQGAD